MTTTTSISSFSTMTIQNFFQNFHSRRMLLHTPLYTSPLANPPSIQPMNHNTTFDANVVMVLSVLLCALICSLGLNSIVRCALRCSNSVSSNPTSSPIRLANTGMKKKALKTIAIINYTNDVKIPGLDTECAICLSDFDTGERVRVLPKCHHGFHVKCIDKWLNSHSSCPTCRHCLIETYHKIVEASTYVPEVAILMEPLRPEGLIRNYET